MVSTGPRAYKVVPLPSELCPQSLIYVSSIHSFNLDAIQEETQSLYPSKHMFQWGGGSSNHDTKKKKVLDSPTEKGEAITEEAAFHCDL